MSCLCFRNTNVNHTPGGVTIVRVGGGGGNRTETVVGSSRTDISLPSRDLAIFQPHTSNTANAGKFGHKYQKHSDTSRSTGRLVTASNRSMPRLNACKYSFLFFERTFAISVYFGNCFKSSFKICCERFIYSFIYAVLQLKLLLQYHRALAV